VDGYNLSYKRDWASQALVSKDEYAGPLVAWGQRGAGRTAAVCFPLGGDFSESVRTWPGYGDFLQTAGRWLMGDDVPPGIGLRWDLAGTALGIDLMYAGDWEQTFAQSPPRILLASGARADERREAVWERIQPGHYRAAIDLTEGEVVRGAIQAGKHALPFGPLTVGSNAEWAFDPARVAELRQVSAQSGGRELVDLQNVWQSPPQRELTDLRRWLLPLALLLVIADALITRMGWRRPQLALTRPLRRPGHRAPAPAVAPPLTTPAPGTPAATAAPVPAPAAIPAPAPKEPATSAPAATTDPAAAERRRQRFARAKKR
jgi:hypothetical protein